MADYEKPQIQSPQVYLNYRGAELRQSFIAHLEMALIRGGVNVYADIPNSGEYASDRIFKGIEESTIALVIFSKGFTESSWCLDELVKIKERVEQNKLMAIPIFYKLSPSEVKRLDGEFGNNLWELCKRSDFDKAKIWKEALEFISKMMGFVFDENSHEPALLNDIVKHVHMALSCLPRQADSAQLRKDDDPNLRKGDDVLSETNSDATPELQDSEEKKHENVSESSTMVTYDQNPRVFINFRGAELRQTFIAHLKKALIRGVVNVYVDILNSGECAPHIFKVIEDSTMALVIFSKGYTESSWCLDELVKIKERVEQNKLIAIPIFYQLSPSEVKRLDGEFGDNLRKLGKHSEFDKLKQWKEALEFFTKKIGLVSNEKSTDSALVDNIVKHVHMALSCLPRQADNLQLRKDDNLNLRKDDDVLSESNFDATPELHDTEEKKQENVSESSTRVTYDQTSGVFINFRGTELRHGFVAYVKDALKRKGVDIFEEENELRGESFVNHFKRIKEFKIALVILSSRYTESAWCLNELVKITELMDERKLVAIPIFYKVEPSQVRNLEGVFGDNFKRLCHMNQDHHINFKWNEALKSITTKLGFCLNKHTSESEIITHIVKEVLKIIRELEGEKPSLFGIEQRMEQLEKKLEFDGNDTQIIGVVGMPGIGKTTLAVMLHEKWKRKFLCCVPFLDIHKKSEEYGLLWLRKRLLELLLKGKVPEIGDETTHGSVKDELLKAKIFAILDDVSDKKQLELLLGKLDWIKKGSKIIITTSDKSLLEGFADDTYVVPKLNDREAFQLFSYHALRGQNYNSTSNLVTLSKMFVDYAQGHPLTLRLLGRELYGKDEVHWASKLEMMTKQSNMMFQDVWKFYTDQLKLSETQKDVLLDIACFFQSEDEYFVRSLLDSGDPDSSEVKDLVNKFLITIADGRVEMNVPLYTFSKDLGSPKWLRLCNYQEIINVLTETGANANNVRGIFLDTSKLKEMCFEASTFIDMQNLRYMKIYDSCCPRQCKADCQLIFPDGLEFPLGELRYLHWVKFPLEELPPDFRPENLVDLRLPYSKITRVWEGEKDTPRLKWVDLSHSSELLDLSALSKAENLQRLNLEGCTSLDELPVEIQNMKSLVFLNLRGCIRLWSLPEMNLISLKTLILSDCSNLEEFQLISESLEFLHLDGTAIKGLPPAIEKLRRLVVLNLKNCKMLACLPNCLGNLKALDKLILSGCSRLKNLPDVTNSLKHLQILLFDETGAKKMPSISCFTGSEGPDSVDMLLQPLGSRCSVREWPLSSLRRLCLSGNDFVTLQPDIGKLYNLKWLDVKHCKKLRSVPMLPPRLQYFDAHGCDSLQTVANPFAFAVLSDQIHATFNFSNCNKLDKEAKANIISYTRWRSQLVRVEFTQYNGGLVSEDLIGTCFPGWEVPVWFSHQASGSVLKPKLLAHWYDNKFTGIGLCAVIEFDGYHNLRKRVLLKCNCEFKIEDGSSTRFSCTVGGWSEPSNTSREAVSSHVFIGFTSMLDINKISEEECVCTETFIEFKVTDGLEEIEGCKVVKCGFSLLYAPEERGNICPDNSYMNMLELQRAYLGAQKSQYGVPYKSGSPNSHSYYGSPTFGSNMSYPGSPLAHHLMPNSLMSPCSPMRRGDVNMGYPSAARNYSGGVMGSWHMDASLKEGFGSSMLEEFKSNKTRGFELSEIAGHVVEFSLEEGFGSSLLEEFKSNKTRGFELSEIAGHVVEFSVDQYGSRFIQQKLETATTDEKNMVYEEIMPLALDLMTDVFGNYVIQKFFVHGLPPQRRELAEKLFDYVLPLSLHMYGCRVIQKAIEVVDLDQKIKMVKELDGHVMRCVRDQNGNHVVQKCIECVPEENIEFIISTFFGYVVTLSTHPYGCRVIQRVLEHCHDPDTQSKVMEEILSTVSMLAQDQYGNYIVQYVLEQGKPDERTVIIKELAGKIVQMSQQKFASNVVEKCLTFGGPEERELLVNEMLGTTDENEPLQAMMQDQFANYVVQKVLETCDDQHCELILTRIKVHLNALKKYTYGKHIVARVEKLVAAGERRMGLQSLTQPQVA